MNQIIGLRAVSDMNEMISLMIVRDTIIVIAIIVMAIIVIAIIVIAIIVIAIIVMAIVRKEERDVKVNKNSEYCREHPDELINYYCFDC